MPLLEKHEQHFLWTSIPALTALRLPLDYSVWVTGSTQDEVAQDREREV